jgi:hypothetical protein
MTAGANSRGRARGLSGWWGALRRDLVTTSGRGCLSRRSNGPPGMATDCPPATIPCRRRRPISGTSAEVSVWVRFPHASANFCHLLPRKRLRHQALFLSLHASPDLRNGGQGRPVR